ncbi:MAG: thermonuclease family protein [Pyrinomonadaceae bacterium]
MAAKLKITTSFLFAILFCSFSTAAQVTMSGKVIDVIDGDTVIIEIPSGKFQATLQFIETPTREQAMFDTVKQHLRQLVYGKSVVFRARTISYEASTGQLTLNDIDMSEQMLRDGAAWLVPVRFTAQQSDEHTRYASFEAAARKENRGIWAVKGLTSSWERRDNELQTAATPRKQIPRTGKWGDVNPKLGNVGALFSGYNAASKTGFLSTGISMVSLNDAGFEDRFRNVKLFVDVTYWYKEEPSGRKGTFVLTLISENDTAMFRRNQEMVLIIDNGKVAVGRGKRVESRSGGKVFEKLTFNISRSNMQHMTKDVTVMKIADHLITPLSVRYIFFNMLEFST